MPFGADRLFDLGMEQLAAGDVEEALRTADRLIRKQDPGGHELKVSALLESDAIEDAVRAAEEGVARFPDEWSLYCTLGIALARFDCFDEAAGALERALHCEGADPAEIHVNLATVRGMQGDWEACLAVLSDGEDWGDFEFPRMILQCDALLELERWRDATAFADATQQEWGDDLDPGMVGMLIAVRALAAFRANSDPRRAMKLAWEALRAAPSQSRALEVIRLCDDLFSPTSRIFEVECAVELEDQEGAPLSFCSAYAVIAESLDEALEFIQRYEENVSGGSPTLADFEDLGPAALEACGVVEVIPIDGDDDGDEG